MTSAELRAAREHLGLSQRGLAIVLRMGKHGGRTVRRWELGEIDVPGPVAVAIGLMLERAGFGDDRAAPPVDLPGSGVGPRSR